MTIRALMLMLFDAKVVSVLVLHTEVVLLVLLSVLVVLLDVGGVGGNAGGVGVPR